MTVSSSKSTVMHGAVQCNLWIGSEKLMVESFFEFYLIFSSLMNILCNLQPTIPDVRLLGTWELHTGLSWQRGHSTRKRLIRPANLN
jgi:hypothetical protein